MAISNPKLVAALRTTAHRLSSEDVNYEWGHMARCNCGHLVQTITCMSDRDIARAVDFELDEWTEYAREVCDNTGHSVENLFLAMREVGFLHEDVIHLEHLSDENVLARIPNGQHLRKNDPKDVSTYMNQLADMLEAELA